MEGGLAAAVAEAAMVSTILHLPTITIRRPRSREPQRQPTHGKQGQQHEHRDSSKVGVQGSGLVRWVEQQQVTWRAEDEIRLKNNRKIKVTPGATGKGVRDGAHLDQAGVRAAVRILVTDQPDMKARDSEAQQDDEQGPD